MFGPVNTRRSMRYVTEKIQWAILLMIWINLSVNVVRLIHCLTRHQQPLMKVVLEACF